MTGISERKDNCCKSYIAKAKGGFCSKKSSKELQFYFLIWFCKGNPEPIGLLWNFQYNDLICRTKAAHIFRFLIPSDFQTPTYHQGPGLNSLALILLVVHYAHLSFMHLPVDLGFLQFLVKVTCGLWQHVVLCSPAEGAIRGYQCSSEGCYPYLFCVDQYHKVTSLTS